MPLPSSQRTLEPLLRTVSGHGWKVVLFNCYCHTFDEVVEQVCKAISCSSEIASQLTQVAEMTGSVTVFQGGEQQCEKVASILGATGLQVDVVN